MLWGRMSKVGFFSFSENYSTGMVSFMMSNYMLFLIIKTSDFYFGPKVSHNKKYLKGFGFKVVLLWIGSTPLLTAH